MVYSKVPHDRLNRRLIWLKELTQCFVGAAVGCYECCFLRVDFEAQFNKSAMHVSVGIDCLLCNCHGRSSSRVKADIINPA